MDKVLVALGVGFVFWCIGDAIVRIIRTSKGSGGGKRLEQKVLDLESDLANVEQDLEDAKERIVVLEKIVTDERRDLRRQIDDLAN
ncbi:MAG: hypothetical protein KDI19_15085 [Pseudomonadales bacterium]|nr:hypothetical protein [Pseudomonadales bacterium]